MIRRSRPKYLDIQDIEESKNIYTRLNEEIYLDSGSSALKFLLTCLSEFYKKELTLCMQAFNCNTVLDAALEVKNIKILLSDVKIEDYSISLEFIQKNSKQIDILFLLHYQGKVNDEYDGIINYCSSNNIIVIEDLAHINENNFDLKGDYGIYSYSFDKPYTCMNGGKIIFKDKYSEISKLIEKRYFLLRYEPIKKTVKDIKLLEYLFIYSSVRYYIKGTDDLIIIKNLLNIFSSKTTYKILKNKFLFLLLKTLYKIYFKLFDNQNVEYYPVLRINDMKIHLIEKQINRYLRTSEYYCELQNKIIKYVENIFLVKIDNKTEWNRLSFLNSSKKLFLENIEAGNFNWSMPLNKQYNKHKNVHLSGNYDISEYLSNNIINFPIWTDEIINNIQRIQGK